MAPELISMLGSMAGGGSNSSGPFGQVAMGIQAGMGVAQTIGGLIGEGKDNRLLAENAKARPLYTIKKPVTDNYNLALNHADQGLSDESLKNYNDANSRNLTASIDGLIRGGSHLNNVGELYGNNQYGTQRMALTDDEMRARNVQNLMNRGDVLAGEEDKAWQVNTWAPWADRQQALVQKLQNDRNQVSQGISNVVGAAANKATEKQYSTNIDSVYGQPGDVYGGMGAGERAVRNLDNIMGTTTPNIQPVQNATARNITGGYSDASSYNNLQLNWPGLFIKR